MGKPKRRGALAPQNRGQKKRNRAQPGKRRQGGKGRPFEKGQPDLPEGKRFEPGASGNPGGRPRANKECQDLIRARGFDLVNTLFEIVDELPERRGRSIVGPSHRDRVLAVKELRDWGFGRPKQSVEISGPGGRPIEHRPIEEMTSAEREQEIDRLLAEGGDRPEQPADGDPQS